MDCYSGMNFEELVVPNYHESSSDTYPSTGMWDGWSMNSPAAAEKCFDYDGFDGEGFLYSPMSMRTSEEEEEDEEEFKRSEAFYGESSLHDFDGIEQMDDIFLSSILEDVPGNDHRASSNSNSVGSSSMYGDREVPMVHCHVMPLKGEVPFTISDLSEENMLDYVDELSSEELVLQDLQRASGMLTDETRKCFRETFYRLARNSHEKSDSANSEEFLVQTSRYDYGDGTRLSREEEIESETNSMDRTIANFTFNKMESNISNFPLSERVQ